MEKQKNRRSLRNYLILKDVQLKLMAINFLNILLVVTVTVTVLMAPLYLPLAGSASMEEEYYAALFSVALTKQLPIVLGLVLLLFIGNQFIITHQFCGPIKNFCNTFREITSGNLTRKVRLRKRDMLQSEAESINSMIDGLTQLIGGIKKEHAGLLLSLQNVCVSPGVSGEQQKSEEALRAALQQAQNIKRSLEMFSLADDPARQP
jgi:methyl-accepting chemotaxis protein